MLYICIENVIGLFLVLFLGFRLINSVTNLSYYNILNFEKIKMRIFLFKTVVMSGPETPNPIIIRGCLESCASNSDTLFVSCCTSDLCNADIDVPQHYLIASSTSYQQIMNNSTKSAATSTYMSSIKMISLISLLMLQFIHF